MLRTLQIAIIASVIIFGVLASTDNAFSATFTVSKDVSGEDNDPNGVVFNNDGTKMFMLGDDTPGLFEYDCSTAFDLSTCIVNSGAELDPSAQGDRFEDVTFNEDGFRIYILETSPEVVVNHYNCSAGFDVSSCSFAFKLDISPQDGSPTGLAWNTGGSQLQTVGAENDKVYRYNCFNSFDVTSCTFSSDVDISAGQTNPTSLRFNNDGTKMFITGTGGIDVSEFSCPGGFVIHLCTYSGDAEKFNVSAQAPSPTGLAFNDDGTKMYVLGDSSLSVHEYSLPVAFDVSSSPTPSTVPAETGGGGGNDRAKSAPTSGDDWNTHNLIVEGGITANGVTYDIEDNWHTDFDLLKVKTGSPNKFVTKTWSQNGGLLLHEIAFGIPEVGSYDKAEAIIEVWYNHDKSIDKVVLVQETRVINEQFLRVSTDQVKCREGNDAMCYQTSFDVLFYEPLQHDIFAIKSVDMTRRSMSPTYLNDGIDVHGRTFSSMPTMTIPGPEKYEGLIEITQTEKYSDLWMAQDGRIFEIFGESDSVRLVSQEMARDIDNTKFSERNDSGFENYKNLINERYILIFDASELQKQIPESFAYEFPDVDSRTQFLIDSGLIDFVRK